MEFLLDTHKRDRTGGLVQVAVWIPRELLVHIVSMLDYHELPYVHRVSRELRNAVNAVCSRWRGARLYRNLPTGDGLCFTWRGAGRGVRRIGDACAYDFAKAYHRLCAAAAWTGKLALVQAACDHGCSITEATLEVAATLGAVDILQWAHMRGGVTFNSKKLVQTAAIAGQLPVIRFLLNRDPPVDIRKGIIFHIAVRFGHQHILACYLRTPMHNLDWTEVRDSITTAASRGHVAVLKHLVERRFIAASEFDHVVCAHFAARGDLATLQWLRASGAQWDYKTCNCAAEADLATLQWAYANGAPLLPSAYLTAMGNGHVDVLVWLEEVVQLKPPIYTGPDPRMRIAHDDDLEEEEFVALEHGLDMSVYIEQAARRGHFAAVQWAAKRYALDYAQIAYEAGKRDHLHIVKWLCREPGADITCSTYMHMMEGAVEGGAMHVVRWIWKQITKVAQIHAEELRHMAMHADGVVLDWLRKKGAPWGPDSCLQAINRGDGFSLYPAHNGRAPHEMPCKGTCKIALELQKSYHKYCETRRRIPK